jgi:NAD(P)-dependent dehydrogenase (short-subunit alcohol dehydrogenase family)
MGRELVGQFARRGWNVAALMRRPRDGAFAELPNVRVLAADVTEPDSVRAAVAETSQVLGPIDVVVNNAGFAQLGSLEEASLDQWRAQYETNVFGIVTVVSAVLPQMRARRAGHVINIASMGGHVSLPTMSVYTSSKFAVEGLSEGLAKEIAPLGIKLTIVEPCGYDTSFADNANGGVVQLPDYDAARQAMQDFSATSRYGDIERSMSAVVDIAGIDDPPRRLAVGSFGLEMVRGKLAELADNYNAWEAVTLATD